MSSGDTLRETLAKALDADIWRSKQPYDGVLGTLPQWVPENFQVEFKTTRNQLIRNGHKPDDICRFMVDVVETEQKALASPDNPPGFNPNTPFEIYEKIITLAKIQHAVGLGPEQGLAYVTDPRTAQQINMGKKHSQSQSRKARRPRGKVSDDGETIRDVIRRIASREPDEGAKALWPRFLGELDRRQLDPVEEGHPTDEKKSAVKYDNVDGERKSMTFGRFEKVVSAYNTGKKFP